MTHRTRIKICGLTRMGDVEAAVDSGADAIGFVFYPKSPRYISATAAARLLEIVPPFVTTVGLFVNASTDEVAEVVAQAPVAVLQFHGDETAEQCYTTATVINRPFIRALRIKPQMRSEDLIKYSRSFHADRLFNGLLLDAFVDGYGGAGRIFDWSLIPKELASQVVLSGGLNVQNVIDAVVRVRPYAVDVSSGVELEKGIKDPDKISAFIEAIRLADTIT